MKNPKLITALIAVVVLATFLAAGMYIYSLNNEPDVQDSRSNTSTSDTEADNQFAELEAQYTAMKGEEYDKAFVTEMVAHHKGAVSMSHLAISKAKHQELKDMAQSIVDAQIEEIRTMEAWKKEWGYSTATQGSGAMAGMDHGNGEMEQMMAGMTQELSAESGDEFDKAFLELMIEHHESAIAMARPGTTNAGRQEVKDLALAIVGAQTQEIAQMRQWQKDWGYN